MNMNINMNMKKTLQTLRLVVLSASCLTWTAAFAQITPLGDSYTNTAAPNTNYGAAAVLAVDSASHITYIQFNLASIPATAAVSEATLKLYVNSVNTAGTFNVDYVSGAWSENRIDGTNAPALGSTIASDVNITAADLNQYILINVTSAVQAWLSGGAANNGIALVANGAFNATFDSKENINTSHPAELDIAYKGGDGTITGVTTASSSGLSGGGTSGTLNLSLTTACASGQGLSWSGSAWVCTALSGGGTITGVTAGTGLSGGGASGTVTLNNTGLLGLTAGAGIASSGGQTPTLSVSGVPLLIANNTFTGNNLFTPTAAVDAIDAYTSGPGKSALVGIEYATSGASYGVWASTFDPTGAGVSGINYGTSGTATGVYGSGVGNGVYGLSTSGSGVDGSSTSGSGVWGSSTSGNGVVGISSGTGSSGVLGSDSATSGGSYGVWGETYDPSGAGVLGINYAAGGTGVIGSGTTGVYAQGGAGGWAMNAFNSQSGIGLLASSDAGQWAGWFNGNVEVNGTLSKGGGSFKIDHPLDPANKYLYHSFVESPDMMNIYNGNVILDGNGEAVVTLPEWFETLNRDFRYQLACIGGFAPVYVAEEVSSNSFKIAGGKAGLKVSWQVTGIRQDAWANAHRIPVEEEKPELERGFYLHPELYGAPAEKGVLWAIAPQAMKRMKEAQAKAAAHQRATVAAKP
jgi:hypothetical protein